MKKQKKNIRQVCHLERKIEVILMLLLSLNNDFSNLNNLFKKENVFKGKIGIFEIKDKEINHRLNFYKIENNKFIEIF